MGRLFLTGDTHNYLEINRLSFKNFPLGYELTKDDIIIILGDFGFPWDGQKADNYWLDWLEDKPFSIAFVDGNHVNFSLLYQYPEEQWKGGKTHILRPHIHHLCRGEIFTFNNQTFFTFGGARSVDKARRKEGVSWWPQEIPNREEMEHGILTLEKYNFNVDFILTHCAPNTIVDLLYPYEKQRDDISNYLEKNIWQDVNFKKWFCGHYHIDRSYNNQKFNIIYKDVLEIMPDGRWEIVA